MPPANACGAARRTSPAAHTMARFAGHHAVAAGKATLGVSGPRQAYDIARPYIAALGRAETYIGEGDSSRLAKLAHNVMLGVVAQCMAEITVLCEKGGIERHAFLNYFNNSAMSSTFTKTCS